MWFENLMFISHSHNTKTTTWDDPRKGAHMQQQQQQGMQHNNYLVSQNKILPPG